MADLFNPDPVDITETPVAPSEVPIPAVSISYPPIGTTAIARALMWAQQFIPEHVGAGHYPTLRSASCTDERVGYVRPHLWAGWRYTCLCGKTYDSHWVGDKGDGLDLFQTDHASLEIALLVAAGEPLP